MGYAIKSWLALAVAAIAGCWQPAYAADATAVAAYITGDAGRSVFTLELDQSVTYKIFTLDQPYRVVVDLPAMEFHLPKGTGAPGRGTALVTDFRYGSTGPGKSRLVIDASAPVLVEAAGIGPHGGGGIQLKIALSATDPQTFAAKLPRRAASAKVPAPPGAAIFPPKGKAGAKLARMPMIVLDPGHGGPDSGAISPNGADEKNMVLAIGLKVRDKLAAAGKYKVLMTRDTDVFVTLKGRVDFAEEHNADLMVSIHADDTEASGRWQSVSGATVYTRSETASDEESRLVALKENMSDLVAGEALPPVEGNDPREDLYDLARTDTKAMDQVLAEQAVKRLAKVTPMTPEPHREARFYVLKSPKVPAMLIETGYVNNKLDESRLVSPEWQDKLAAAIVSAIDAYFGERDKGISTLFGLGGPDPVQ